MNRNLTPLLERSLNKGDGARFSGLPVEWWDKEVRVWRPSVLWSVKASAEGILGGILVPVGSERGLLPGIREVTAAATELRVSSPVEAATSRVAMGLIKSFVAENVAGQVFTPQERLTHYQQYWAPWADAWSSGYAERPAEVAEVRAAASIRAMVGAWREKGSALTFLVGKPVGPTSYQDETGSWHATVGRAEGEGYRIVAWNGEVLETKLVSQSQVVVHKEWGVLTSATRKLMLWFTKFSYLESVLAELGASLEERDLHPISYLSMIEGADSMNNSLLAYSKKVDSEGKRLIETKLSDWGIGAPESS